MLRDKPIAPRFILAAILCVVICIMTSILYQVTNGCHYGNPPLRNFYVMTAELSQEKQIIQTFQQFASKNSFSFAIVYYTPDHGQLNIALTRKDVEVDITNVVPSGLETYLVGLYNNDCLNPTTASAMDNLVSNLKTFISEIPNVTITDEK